jgi:glycosyltransferase involved in cell wall biosynthesis
MSVLARSGRVLYVEPPLDIFSVLGRRRRWGKLSGMREVQERLWVLSPVVVVDSSLPSKRTTFHRGFLPRVVSAARRLGFESPVVWSFSPEHVVYAGGLGESVLIYHAADDPAGLSRDPDTTRMLERELMERSDIVFVASQSLYEARSEFGNIHRLKNAADVVHYGRVLVGDASASLDAFLTALRKPRGVPRELAGLEGPVILYGGAAYGWFDFELVADLAKMRPDWNLVMVGPSERPAPPPGVLSVGRKRYDEFPWYVAAADVTILPLREGSHSRNCDPIILFEYLLCGKPVVATPFPAAAEHGDLVTRASDAAGFEKAISSVLDAGTSTKLIRRRVKYALDNTWENRAEAALGLIEKAGERAR